MVIDIYIEKLKYGNFVFFKMYINNKFKRKYVLNKIEFNEFLDDLNNIKKIEDEAVINIFINDINAISLFEIEEDYAE